MKPQDIDVYLQKIKFLASKSFERDIQRAMSDIIKTVNKSFKPKHESIKSYIRMGTDENMEWILHNDKRIEICIRPFSYKGKFSDGAVTLACCRMSIKTGNNYIVLVEIDGKEAWRVIQYPNFTDSIFEEMDSHDRYMSTSSQFSGGENFDASAFKDLLLR